MVLLTQYLTGLYSLTAINAPREATRVGRLIITETNKRGAVRLSTTVALNGSAVRARGKFIHADDEKLLLRGVTYGTFQPDPSGDQYGTPHSVARDFSAMAANGINAVRTYTVPPQWLLDLAQENGLRLMVGLPWEQHIAFLGDRARPRAIERGVRDSVRRIRNHPAVLSFAVGNEIPASIVRWHGPRRVEKFIGRLCEAVRDESPDSLVTYVNFPTTEYLELPFLDFLAFNVYLERQEQLTAYLARLQNLAGDRPLVMAEIGLDSLRSGEVTQARTLDWQVRTAFDAGCAGAFVFSWTDEWHRGGYEVEDWDFGLTTRDRFPKPALTSVASAFAEASLPATQPCPRVSVVVCTCNGSRTIRETLEGLGRLRYPDFEVIVVDDGSTDGCAEIASEYPVRVIRTPNRGLSSARNSGLSAASGEIVAYIDDDAYPDPDWLTYLASTFRSTGHAGVGGPNIVPEDDGLIAQCVANAPGGPIHVLLSDTEAEHIPGCNMAFRKECLEAIGGFDPQFRAAGDDVDVCWRLQERGWTLGFNPTAVVWHHRRGSVRAFWKQQKGYGRAEAMLERKWPRRYNSAGHVAWAGRLYGRGVARLLALRGRIYHGSWGGAPFQSVYAPVPTLLGSLPLMPEWYLIVALLGVVSLLGLVSWPLLLAAVPLFLVAALTPLAAALRTAYLDSRRAPRRAGFSRTVLWLGSTLLHVVQPVARLYGRLSYGLSPFRRHARGGFALPRKREHTVWSESWRMPEEWLSALQRKLEKQSAIVMAGGDYDAWDLEIRGGSLGAIRVRMGVEEHGNGRQLLRFRSWPRLSAVRVGAVGLLAGIALAGLAAKSVLPATVLGAAAVWLLGRRVAHLGLAQSVLARSLGKLQKQAELRAATSTAPEQADEPVIEMLMEDGERSKAVLPAGKSAPKLAAGG